MRVARSRAAGPVLGAFALLLLVVIGTPEPAEAGTTHIRWTDSPRCTRVTAELSAPSFGTGGYFRAQTFSEFDSVSSIGVLPCFHSHSVAHNMIRTQLQHYESNSSGGNTRLCYSSGLTYNSRDGVHEHRVHRQYNFAPCCPNFYRVRALGQIQQSSGHWMGGYVWDDSTPTNVRGFGGSCYASTEQGGWDPAANFVESSIASLEQSSPWIRADGTEVNSLRPKFVPLAGGPGGMARCADGLPARVPIDGIPDDMPVQSLDGQRYNSMAHASESVQAAIVAGTLDVHYEGGVEVVTLSDGQLFRPVLSELCRRTGTGPMV